MPAPEQEQARRLARVLDGEESGDGETRALAALLERAAESARLEVSAAEVERALGRSRGRVRDHRRRPSLRLGLAFAGVAATAAAAFALVVAAPFGELDVAAEASAALAREDVVLSVVERVAPARPGTFEESIREGWLDLEGGRARWTQKLSGLTVSETLVEPGSIRHYLPTQGYVLVGPSCRTFVGGCADVVDPIAFYRDALATAARPDVGETTFAGRKAYRIVLPVQALPDGARIEQVATVDAESYLPRRIVWQDVAADGSARPFAIIEIDSLRLVPRGDVPPDAFVLELPEDVRVVERGEAGEVVGERPITLAEARALDPPIYWLGPEFRQLGLEAIDEVRLEGGVAYRLRYGDIVVWSYTDAAPAEIVAAQTGPAKVVPLDGGTARFTFPPGGPLVGELEGPERSAAIVAPESTKLDIFRALDSLEPLR